MDYQVSAYKNDIVFIEVSNGNNLKATFSNFGAGVYKLKYKEMPLILEIEDKEKWLYCPQFYGKTLARVAGRIRCNGEIDGETYSLKETMAGYCLHGGEINSLSFKPWKYEVKEFKNRIEVIFSINSRVNENGFPGNAKLKVIYQLFANDNFKIVYKGSTSTKTLLNLSNHNYYNLFNSKDVSDYTLKINASKYGVIDDTTFITGTDDVPSYLDFRHASKLNPKLSYIEKGVYPNTIDHTFIFDEVILNKPQVILKNNECKISLYTDYPAINIFCDNFKTPIKFTQFNEVDTSRRALALEPQLYNLDIDSLKIRKGDKYKHFILLKIKDLRK